MKLTGLFLICALAFASAAPSCATVPPGTPPTPTTNLEACSDAAVSAAAKGILGEVTSALATGNYIAALADLAGRFGGPEVVCAVTFVVQELQSKAAASNDPVVASELAHGQVYLRSPDAAKAAKRPVSLRGGSSADQEAHNLLQLGSTPSPATSAGSIPAGWPTLGSKGAVQNREVALVRLGQSLDACDTACGSPGSSVAPPSGCQCWRADRTDWRRSRWVAANGRI